MTNIELPRDAAGREIQLDTKVLYDKDNKEHKVLNYIFNTDTGNWIADFETEIDSELHATECFSLNPPDSWEKLLDDLDKAASKTYCGTCTYFGKKPTDCDTFVIGDISACDSAAIRDIASRIRKLRSED